MLRTHLALGAVGAAMFVAGCADPLPPADWARGGGRLDLPQAMSSYDGDSVQIRSRGAWAEVLVDGDVELILDRVGRVYTRRRHPFALLEPDGRLLGREDQPLGFVGSANAALPGRASAWISLNPNGQVVKYDRSGGQVVGAWTGGCFASPWAAQACVLVTYLLHLKDATAGDFAADTPMMTPGLSVGVGVGVGIP